MLNTIVIGVSIIGIIMNRFLSKLAKKRTKKQVSFKKMITRYLDVKRKSLPINDGLNILIKTVYMHNSTVICVSTLVL